MPPLPIDYKPPCANGAHSRANSAHIFIRKHPASPCMGIMFPSIDDTRAPPSPVPTPHSHFDFLVASRFPSPNLNVAQYTSPYSRLPTPSWDRERERDIHSLPVLPTAAPPNFLPSHVMEALVEEDMVRLRARSTWTMGCGLCARWCWCWY